MPKGPKSIQLVAHHPVVLDGVSDDLDGSSVNEAMVVEVVDPMTVSTCVVCARHEDQAPARTHHEPWVVRLGARRNVRRRWFNETSVSK